MNTILAFIKKGLKRILNALFNSKTVLKFLDYLLEFSRNVKLLHFVVAALTIIYCNRKKTLLLTIALLPSTFIVRDDAGYISTDVDYEFIESAVLTMILMISISCYCLFVSKRYEKARKKLDKESKFLRSLLTLKMLPSISNAVIKYLQHLLLMFFLLCVMSFFRFFPEFISILVDKEYLQLTHHIIEKSAIFTVSLHIYFMIAILFFRDDDDDDDRNVSPKPIPVNPKKEPVLN